MEDSFVRICGDMWKAVCGGVCVAEQIKSTYPQMRNICPRLWKSLWLSDSDSGDERRFLAELHRLMHSIVDNVDHCVV